MEYWKNLELENIVYTDENGTEHIEVWKDIPIYDGNYQASSLGRIKYTGIPYTDSIGRVTPKKARIRIQSQLKTGYLQIILRREGKNVSERVHRLVAKSFIENVEDKCCVNHKNSDKEDNRLINIEWCTVRENSKHWIENDSTVGSNYIGIQKSKKYGYYKAYIEIEKVVYFLGIFDQELEAKDFYENTLKNWIESGIKPEHKNRTRFTSKYKGVYFAKDREIWVSQFIKGRQTFHVGNFKTEIEASEAYRKVEEEFNISGVFPTKVFASKYKFINYLRGKWQANALNVEGVKKKYLGIFKTEEEAVETVREYLGLESIEQLLR